MLHHGIIKSLICIVVSCLVYTCCILAFLCCIVSFLQCIVAFLLLTLLLLHPCFLPCICCLVQLCYPWICLHWTQYKNFNYICKITKQNKVKNFFQLVNFIQNINILLYLTNTPSIQNYVHSIKLHCSFWCCRLDKFLSLPFNHVNNLQHVHVYM